MSTLELKQEFHNLIDSIDNSNLLSDFYQLLKSHVSTKDGVLWNKLTQEQQKELLLSFEESKDSSNLMSNDSMLKKHKKWL